MICCVGCSARKGLGKGKAGESKLVMSGRQDDDVEGLMLCSVVYVGCQQYVKYKRNGSVLSPIVVSGCRVAGSKVQAT